jgi:hypothetical protein
MNIKKWCFRLERTCLLSDEKKNTVVSLVTYLNVKKNGWRYITGTKTEFHKIRTKIVPAILLARNTFAFTQ